MSKLLRLAGQPALFVFLHALGTSVAVAIGPRSRPHLCGAFGFMTGLAVMVALELLMLGVGIPFTALTGMVASVAAITVSLAVARRRGALSRASWRVLVGWTIGAAIAAIAVTRVNLAIMTYDSHYIVMMGGVIGRDGTLAPGMLAGLGDYGIFTVIAQSLVGFTGESYLWALPTMLSASAIAIFAVMLDHGLGTLGVRGRRRALAVALVTAATFTTFMVIRHSFYIQTNLGTASYLLAFCTLFWWSEVTDEREALPLAFVALFAISLHRIEGPAMAVLFLALALLPSRIPARAVLLPLALTTAAVAGWYLLLASGVSPGSEFLTPNKCYLMAAIPIAFTAYVALSASGWLPWLAAIERRTPLLVSGALVLALIGAFATHYDLMYQSADGWLRCLIEAPYWEHTWAMIALLTVAGLAVPAPPARTVFTYGIPAYLAAILLLVLGRTPYYFGLGDSATRMSLHVVPLAFFYFGLKFVPLVGAPAAGRA